MLAVVAGLLALPAAPSLAGKADDTLNVGFRLQLQGLDAYYAPGREGLLLSFWAYDALVYRDPKTLEFKPLLSTGWRQVDDRTLEFDIREGVKFHDGTVLTADDVTYTINFAVRPESKVFNQFFIAWIEGAKTVAANKVQITAKAVAPMALQYLTGLPIYPAKYYQQVGKEGMAAKPVGTGPYIARALPNNSFEFKRNPDYFADSPKGKPPIGRMVYKTIPDVSTQVAELLTGGLDWAYHVPNDQAEQLKTNPRLKVVNEESYRVAYLTLDAAGKSNPSTPMRDVRVRRAISHAIDREAIAKNLVGGASRVIHSACYPKQFGCIDDVMRFAYDPAKAKALLAEAGYADGFAVEIYGYRSRQIAEAIIGNLRAVGIRGNLNWLQYPAVVEKRRSNQAPMIVDDWGSASFNDVAAIVPVFFNGGIDDYSMDAEVTKLVDTGGTSLDPKLRAEVYAKALQRIAEQAFWVPLHTMPINYVFSADLDMAVPSDEIPEFFRARWK